MVCLVLSTTTTAEALSPRPSYVGPVLQMLIVLVIMVAVLFVVARLLRRLPAFRPPVGEHMRVIERMPLGPKHQLLLVEVEGRKLLLGASESGLRHLADMEPSIDETEGIP